jgi:hypothetical protein
LAKSTSFRPALNLLGFVFGITSGCFAISNAIISFMIIFNNFFASTAILSSITSEISLVLCITVMILGFLLIRGSLMVWRMSVLGGAINLATGIVLTTIIYALFTISGEILGQFYFISMVMTALMSLFSILSGCFALTALYSQVERRFTLPKEIEQNNIKVAVTLPNGDNMPFTSKTDITISQLKKQIADKEGMDFEKTAVIYRGKKVSNELSTLSELGLREGDRITLI